MTVETCTTVEDAAAAYVALLAGCVHAQDDTETGNAVIEASTWLTPAVTSAHVDPDGTVNVTVDPLPTTSGAARVMLWLLDELAQATGRTRAGLVAELGARNAERSLQP